VAASAFDLEQLRLQVAHKLPANCFDDFQRLSRTLLHGPVFQWLLVDAPHDGLRKEVMAALAQVLAAAGMTTNTLPLSGRIKDVAMLEARLVNNASKADVVHVIGRPGWFDSAKWDAFNVRRERIARDARARLVFWLDAPVIELASRGAPDLWAWRGGVYAFALSETRASNRLWSEAHGAATTSLATQPVGPDNRTLAARSRRMHEIRVWLDANASAPDALRAGPVAELGRLLFEVGEFDAALAHLRGLELPLLVRLNDERAVAIAHGQIAEILTLRGQLDEALRIRREQELPVYERLGELRLYALTQRDIAGLLQEQGHMDEALRIRREKEIPYFAKLGDARELAITKAKVAEICEGQGLLDLALGIWRNEVVPVFEKLGDLHALATARGRVAGVLQKLGQIDEALRIMHEQVLPMFEQLGDPRGRALAQARIGQLLMLRQPPDAKSASVLMNAAYVSLLAMQLSEAEQLATEMRGLGIAITTPAA
jgi:tetratricopeptide (TPR) repeat protein